MATNWPPLPSTYPAWPPPEIKIGAGGILSFSSILAISEYFRALGFSKANPTSAENQAFFQGVRCDHGHVCQGLMLVSPSGDRRWPFAYCVGANHKAALVFWKVSETTTGDPIYELGALSAEVV